MCRSGGTFLAVVESPRDWNPLCLVYSLQKPEPVQAAAPAPPLRRPPAAGAPRRSSGDEDSEIIELEEKAARLRRRAVDLNRVTYQYDLQA